jgi:hypothetical protein
MIGSIFFLFADDVPDPGPASPLPSKFLSDVYGDPLKRVAFLFELCFCFAASPAPKGSIRSTSDRLLSFFGPFSAHRSPFFCVTHSEPAAGDSDPGPAPLGFDSAPKTAIFFRILKWSIFLDVFE